MRYGHQRASVKTAMSIPSGVWWYIKKDEAVPLVMVIALRSLHCFDTDGWKARWTSGPYPTLAKDVAVL